MDKPSSPEKLKMRTPSLADENFQYLATKFPNAVTEAIDGDGKVIRAIDKDVLAQEINAHVVDGREERYQFTWPDKKKSVLLANAPIAAALRPCREGSVNFDDTENLYIEGDNLDVLKLLRETYLNRVKMIYIDPPYNTGNDFVYNDDFSEDADEFLYRDEQYDEQGDRLVINRDSNGRFHTDWLNMMYPRLRIARDLLTDDGVIFISIADSNDNSEAHNLRKICDEIFGQSNFLVNSIWLNGRTSSAHFTHAHEYVLGYAKNLSKLPFFKYKGNADVITDRTIKKPGEKNPASIITFPAGVEFECEDKIFPNRFGDSEPIEIVDGILECRDKKLAHSVSIKAGWAMKDMIINWLKGVTVIDQKGQKVKRFFFKNNGVLQYEKERGTVHPSSIIKDITTKSGTSEVSSFLGNDVFQFPKPTDLINYFTSVASVSDDTILDFFSGSATTAHAVMQLNAEDGGKRKFIMVQIPEECNEKSEAAKAGFKNICEIGKERIRRAGQNVLAEWNEKWLKQSAQGSSQELLAAALDERESKNGARTAPDVGFRVLKLDSSNMKDVYYTADKYAGMQLDLEGLADNIKEGRTDEDLLFQVMLELGIPLSAKISRDGDVLCVDGDYLVACFQAADAKLLTKIAKKKPHYSVFRDSSFASDSAMVNFEQIFKTYSPDTIRRVL